MSQTSKYTVAVAGTGYVGLSVATLLSQHNKVFAVDIIPEKVEERVPVGFNKIYPEGGDGNPFVRIRYL